MPRLSRASRDSLIVGAVALVVRIPAFFAPQPLSFDDGNFGMSVITMRHGGLPFKEVFSSQGPLFLPIAWLGDLLTLRSLDSPRTAAVLAGVALSVLVLHVGRRLAEARAARFGALLVALSGSVLWTTGPITSDGIAEALTVGCALAAIGYWTRPTTARAVAIGVLAGAALAVKSLLVVPGLAAAGLWVLIRRRPLHVVAVPLVAAVVVLITSLPWGLTRVYDQYVRYHTDAVADRPIDRNAAKLFSTLASRDAPLVAATVVAIIIVVIAVARRRRSDPAAPDASAGGTPPNTFAPWWPVAVWLGLAVAVVLTESPMWRNHVAHVAVPLALLTTVALGRDPDRAGRRVAIAIAAAILLIPVAVVNLGELVRPRAADAHTQALERRLRALPPGALVVSDTPGLVWRAGRRVPDTFVDTSILRITSPTPSLQITEGDVVDAARRPDVCAVVQWSDKRFYRFADLGARLEAEGYRTRLRRPGDPRMLWEKVRCAPPATARAGRTTAGAGPVRSPD